MKKILVSLFPLILLSASLKLLAVEATKVDVIYSEVLQDNQMLVLTGTVEAKQNAELAPLQSGVVSSLLVEQGDIVEKGQPLMVLDTKLAQLTLAELAATVSAEQASKTEAERLLEEVMTLSKKQLVAETMMAERKWRVDIANAELKRADAQLKHQQEIVARHTLYAPFSGVIANRYIDVGEWVTQQTSAFMLVEQAKLRLNVAIPQEYYGQLVAHSNARVKVIPDFTNAQAILAKLDRLVSVTSNSSRTFTGLVDLPENIELVAGMSARAEIELASADKNNEQNVIWLPKTAIKQHPDGGRSIFTVVDNKAKRVLVNVVKQQGNKVAVRGAPAEQPFVITGVELLKEGDLLSVNVITGDDL